MNHFQRFFLVFLLILLLIGIGGHLLAPVNGSHHVLSESTCAFHHAVDVPVNLQSSWNESGIHLEPTQDDSCALDLVLNIPHPPTF